jgi:tRNA/tmRNA/rRNA uracil-C5-methylase (TrmA/RlmC/RlmD family)
MARDSIHFASAGYHLLEAQPVDMHPQTCQVETVALWERGRGA